MPRSRSPPGIEVFTDAEFRQVRTRDDDSDDDFDWGDSGSDHGGPSGAQAAGGAPVAGTVTIHVQGDDSESPVPFPADCSKYLASLVDGSDLAGGGAVKKHRMLVSRDGLVLCRAFLDAKRQRQREDRQRMRSGGAVNPDDSGGAGTESAVLKESTACATRLMAAARAAHLLRFDDFFDLLAKAFGARLRTVSLPATIRERDIERVANELRSALEMPRRASLSDLSKEEMQAIELFFSHHIGDSTQSCVGGGGGRSDGSTLDVGELAIKESPFLQPSWERDDAVAKCPDCRRDFTAGLSLSWPVVRSHCRVCGKVKCKDCIKHNADPRFARAMKESDVLSQLKCCQRCHDESAHESKRQFLHRFLIASGLNVLEMAALQLVDRDYVVAVHHVFYDIRLSFATGDFVTNPDRARLIMANRDLAAGHTQWVVAVFRCTNWADAFEAEAAYQLLRRTVRVIAPQVIARFDKGGCAAEFGTDAGSGDRMIPELGGKAGGVADGDAASAGTAGLDDEEDDEFADTFPVGKDDDAGPSAKPLGAPPVSAPSPPLQCSHFQLMCTRACVDPMVDYCALELLRTVVTVPDGVGGGFAGPCRDLAAELLLSSIQSPAMKAAWIPVVLDMLHLQPPQSSVRRLRRVVCELCRRDPSTTMQVTRELTARLRIDNDGPMRGTLETVRSDIEALNEFPAGQLHRVTQLISAINRATENWNGGTEPEAKKTLYSALIEFGVASDTQQQQLVTAAGNTSMSVSTSMANPGGSFASMASTSGAALRVPDVVEIHPVPYLFDPAVTIVAIDLARLAVMASKVRPWVVVLVAEAAAPTATRVPATGLDSVAHGSAVNARLGKRYSILYKREDVRQDYVVCNAFAAFNEFFAQRGLLKRPVTTYRVVPTGRDRGIVEMVPDAVSVQSECVGSSSPMKSWLDGQMLHPIRRDDKAGVDRFRDSFLDSARFYTLGTFLLGVGDRHRGNVLLCGGSGSICHIDFGFVLGAMTATESMTSAKHVRYDADLRKVVECYYRPRRMTDKRTVGRGQAFLHDTADMLLALRPYAGFLRLLLHHWVLHDIKRPEEIERFLHARFFVSSNDRDARAQFVDLVEQSFGKNWLQDAAHDVGQIARHGITKNLPFSGWWGGAKGDQ